MYVTIEYEKYTRRNTLQCTSQYVEYEGYTDGSFLCDIFDASTLAPPQAFSHKTQNSLWMIW